MRGCAQGGVRSMAYGGGYHNVMYCIYGVSVRSWGHTHRRMFAVCILLASYVIQHILHTYTRLLINRQLYANRVINY